MANDKDKNFDELLARFYNEADAREVKDDIESGDKLLASFPESAASAELVDNIKAGIDAKLARRPRHLYYKVAAVAAVAALIIVIINLLPSPLPSTRPGEPSPIAVAANKVLDNGGIFSETDADLALFSAEFEQLETSLSTLRLEETANGYEHMADSVDALETKLIEIETIFWKG